MARDLILGLNQYTHSAAACILDAKGKMLFCGEKERVSRKKHDGGDTSEIVEHALNSVGAEISDIATVCANNHLFRIDRFHQSLEWATALFQYQPSYLSEYNILPGVKRLEMSHHLSHAWSALPYAPFDHGLIVVMDGMGSTLHEMQMPGDNYHSDFDLEKHPQYFEADRHQDAFGWREAESAYVFSGHEMQCLHKRFVAEKTPTLLYNYGFENMESLGALYSRVSSHIFADWNSCGKVMGMAPWVNTWNNDYQHHPILSGELNDLQVDWKRLNGAAKPNAWSDSSNHPHYSRLAADMQTDLENVALKHLEDLRRRSQAKNLVLVGGVALNSTLNGRICRESGFDNVFIPHYPGDQGLAAGCAAYAFSQLAPPDAKIERAPLNPYAGREYCDADTEEALSQWQDWVEEAELDDFQLDEIVAQAIADGQVVAWFDGRSEFGPRALGNRSILADPRRGDMVAKINSAIKKREAFRPFAPTVLESHVNEWFEDDTPSPYMSLTVAVREQHAEKIPAVVHEDGSSRIQTLGRDHNPKFYDLIERFYQISNVPMLLNTSFNIKQEPIVETPTNAMRSFLFSELDLLVINGRLFKQRDFPEMLTSSMVPLAAPGFTAETVSNSEGDNVAIRVMAHGDTFDVEQLELGILEVCNGENTLHQIVDYFEQNWDVEQSTVLEQLEALYSRRLVSITLPQE
ncbi:MAG: carbamoyltransferase C-terminal domain-containing protein [Planctomycetota bacterium]|jgi:carbamoyltransferase|nr:carbamoyltransferase C-terminal domain-containing protein [Planctomycetota bacterium]